MGSHAPSMRSERGGTGLSMAGGGAVTYERGTPRALGSRGGSTPLSGGCPSSACLELDQTRGSTLHPALDQLRV